LCKIIAILGIFPAGKIIKFGKFPIEAVPLGTRWFGWEFLVQTTKPNLGAIG
jgi:hypothetical protein